MSSRRKKHGVEILIAEDSPTQAEQLRGILEERGYKVITAADGRQGLEAVRAHKPSLLISDIVMPKMDGYELCREIKSDARLKDVPVILLTSLSSPEDVIKGLQCGADNFIKKPYNAKHLISRIDYILANRELRKNQRVQLNMEIQLGNVKHVINSERQQILDLLVSTYEEAIHLNEDLNERQKELAHSYQSLQGLYRIAEGLNQCTTEQDVAQRALERALELPNVQAGWITRLTKGSEFRVISALGLPPALSDPQALEGNCLCREGLSSNQFPQATNILECQRLLQANGDAAGLRYHATVPLRTNDKLLGSMNLVGSKEGLFSDEELTTLDGIGNQIAMALERAELIQNLEKIVEERTANLIAQIEQRRRVEESLRDSEERTRLLLNSTAEAIYGVDLQGNCMFANPSCLNLLGYNDEKQLLGKNMHEITHQSDTDETYYGHPTENCPIYKAFNSGEKIHSDSEVIWRADGTSFPAECWSYPMYKGDEAIGFVVTFLDITERKQAQEALRESKTRLQLATQASNIGLWDWDLRNNNIYFSPEWKHQLGYEDHEIENRLEEWEKRLHPDDAERTFTVLGDYLGGRRPGCEVEFRLRHKDGSYRWIFTKANTLSDGTGKPYRMLGCHVDITERKNAEMAIAEKNSQIQLLQEVAVAANVSATFADAARIVLERICVYLGWPVGHVYFTNGKGQLELESRGVWYLTDRERFETFRGVTEATRFSAGEGLPGRILVSKRPEWILDVSKDATFRRGQLDKNINVRAGFGVPVMIGAEAVAVMEFYTDKVVEPNRSLLDIAVQIGTQLGRVAERERATNEKQLQLDRIQALHEIDKAIASTLDLPTVLNVLLEKLDLFFTHPSATTIKLLNKDTGRLEPAAARHLEIEAWITRMGGIQPNENLYGRTVLKEQAPLIIPSLQTDPRTQHPEFYREHGLISFAGVPLIAKDQALGVLGIYTKEAHDFNDEEIESLMTLAGQAAIALHTAQLYDAAVEREQRLNEMYQQLQSLHKVATASSESLDLEAILNEVIKQISNVYNFTATHIHLWSPETDEIEVKAAFQTSATHLARVRSRRRGEGIVGRVFDSGEPMIFEDVLSDPCYQAMSRTKAASQEQMRFFAALPIKSKNKPLGVLVCIGQNPRTLTTQQHQLLASMCNQLGIAVENATLYRKAVKRSEELEKANKIKDEFLSVMSHELRTPLNIIIGYTAMIQEGLFGETNQKQTEGLTKVMAQSTELLRLVSGILDVTQIEAGVAKKDGTPVYLYQFLGELKTSYEIPMKKQLSFFWEYADDLPVLHTDATKLKHILNNLLNNAIKFTDKGTVTLSARYLPEENKMQFKVADTGIGIAKEDLDIIFEMFRQVDGSETRSYGGIGIGLFIVRRYTELLGGRVEVKTEVGKGSTFTVTIPCVCKLTAAQDQSRPVMGSDEALLYRAIS